MWMQHEDFQSFITEAWPKYLPLVPATHVFLEKIKIWNCDIFGHLFKKKRSLLNRLKGIQNSPRYGKSDFLENLEEELSGDLENILDREQLFWLQKSREN
ncbi:hypothetical protein S245_044725 [Arachis hypogaea]|nr:Reverse transcriptase [Arachis hypogaea]